MKFVWTHVALFICGAFIIVQSAPSSSAMDSETKRADASSYVRFGKRNPEEDTFLSNLLEKCYEIRGSNLPKLWQQILLQDKSYHRFGKRNQHSDVFLCHLFKILLEAVTTRNRRAPESSYIRFGKRAPESSYIRFGKRAKSLDLESLQDCVDEQMTRAEYFRTFRPTYVDAVRICQEE